jgi:hypothetical protein
MSEPARTGPHYRLTVQFNRSTDLAAALNTMGGDSYVIVSSLVDRKRGDGVDVGMNFSDGAPPLTFAGTVAWCRRMPESAHIPYAVAVWVNAETSTLLKRIASGTLALQKLPRRHERHNTSMLVTVKAGQMQGPGRLVDLSLSGARIIADMETLPQRGSPVAVEFLEPMMRYKTRPIRSTVRWVDPRPEGRGFGVQFEYMDMATAEVVRREVTLAAAHEGVRKAGAATSKETHGAEPQTIRPAQPQAAQPGAGPSIRRAH